MFRSQNVVAQHTLLDKQCRCIVTPATDVLAESDKYLVRCCMPGLESDDIVINLRGTTLLIQATAKIDMPAGLRVHAMEFDSACYSMNLEMPDDCDTQKVNAHYEDGFLTLTLPRKAQMLGRRVEVQEK